MKRHSDTDIITDLQDLRSLDWSIHKLSVGTPGCFLKAYEETSGERYYYKMSNYDSYRGVFGHECINELIVSRLLDILGTEHLHYQLIYARILVDGKEIETYITRSANFRKKQEKSIGQTSIRRPLKQQNRNIRQLPAPTAAAGRIPVFVQAAQKRTGKLG